KRGYRTGHPDVFGAADNLVTVTVSPPGNTLVLPLDAGRGVRSLAQPERLKYAKGHAATIQGLSGLWTYICVYPLQQAPLGGLPFRQLVAIEVPPGTGYLLGIRVGGAYPVGPDQSIPVGHPKVCSCPVQVEALV